MKNTC